MKIFRKYILPFLILYSVLPIVLAGIVFWMTTNGYAPMVLSEIQFVMTFVISVLIAGLLGYIVMNHNKNIKAVYANLSKQSLLVVCVGEGLFTANALMADLFDGLVLGSLIVIFPLLLYVMKTMRDIKEMLL
ncbi:MAG: hypothetical protein E7077_12980 [Bacteroidales bacterium]|jgi:hypothetical protein|nr:hypothetical protein [Bacteroidales bacterium]